MVVLLDAARAEIVVVEGSQARVDLRNDVADCSSRRIVYVLDLDDGAVATLTSVCH